MREGGGAIYHAHTPQVVLPAPPLFSSLSPLSSVLFTYNLCRGRTILLFFPPRLSVILRFFARSPLSNFRATLPPHALTVDTGAFNVGQWNTSERLPSPSHCIHPHSLFSFSPHLISAGLPAETLLGPHRKCSLRKRS